MMDGFGLYGMFLDTALLLFFTGGALIAFVYFWFQGKLNMDETAKFQMMKEEE